MESDMDIKYVAELARLDLSADEAAALQTEMARIVGYIAELREVDVTGVEATAHASQHANAWREDEVKPSYPKAQMLANAPGVIDDGLIKLPRVLPGEEE